MCRDRLARRPPPALSTSTCPMPARKSTAPPTPFPLGIVLEHTVP